MKMDLATTHLTSSPSSLAFATAFIPPHLTPHLTPHLRHIAQIKTGYPTLRRPAAYRTTHTLIWMAEKEPIERPPHLNPERTGDLRIHPWSRFADNVKAHFHNKPNADTLNSPSNPHPKPLHQPHRITDADPNDTTTEHNKTDHNKTDHDKTDHAKDPLHTMMKPLLAIGQLATSLEKQSEPLLNLMEQLGYLPIHTAVHLKRADVITQLAQLGQSSDAMNDHLLTPLMIACHLSNRPIATQLMTQLGADPNIVDRNGFNCLYYACGLAHLEKPGYRAEALKEAFDNIDLIQCLLEQGANPNQQDRRGETLLHHLGQSTLNLSNILRQKPHHSTLKESHHTLMNFITQKTVAQVMLLLEHRADISVRDNVGHTALHKAAIGGNPQIINAILSAGGDIFLLDQDNNGQTPHDLATQHKQSAAAEALNNAIKKKLPITDIKDLHIPKATGYFTRPPVSQESIKQSESLYALQCSQRRHFMTEWARVIAAFELGLHWKDIAKSAQACLPQLLNK